MSSKLSMTNKGRNALSKRHKQELLKYKYSSCDEKSIFVMYRRSDKQCSDKHARTSFINIYSKRPSVK